MNTEVVDPAGIRGKKMFLPGEISIATGWFGGEVSRGNSTHRKRGVAKLHRSHKRGRTERNPFGNYIGSIDFR